MLAIALMHGWHMQKMDVNNLFLHGKLIKIVYMKQPLGFKDISKPEHVRRLKKAIYGLKQAIKAWYLALKNAIIHLGFQNSHANSSLFVYSHASTICNLLVYVDDLIITGNDTKFISSIIHKIGTQFSLKDMSSLHYFLGGEVIPTCVGLFLSQHIYVHDLLESINMLGANDITTLLSTSTPLKLLDGTAAVDNIEYRRVIRSLQIFH